MLLLLESEPLAGQEAYRRCVNRTIGVYARDADDERAFRPIFLINDLVRYWKTLCLNYEGERNEFHRAREDAEARKGEDGGEERHAHVELLRLGHRVDLLKLRFNRLWICFNGVAFLLAGVKDRKVSRDHVERLVALHPIARVEELAERLPETAEPLTCALDA